MNNLKNNLIKPGTVLNTKDSTKLTNAIVSKIDNDYIHVITDFGNLLVLTEEELHLKYIISPIWLEYLEFENFYPTIKERLESQIELLEERLFELNSQVDKEYTSPY